VYLRETRKNTSNPEKETENIFIENIKKNIVKKSSQVKLDLSARKTIILLGNFQEKFTLLPQPLNPMDLTGTSRTEQT
jgi:hypothetical protein